MDEFQWVLNVFYNKFPEDIYQWIYRCQIEPTPAQKRYFQEHERVARVLEKLRNSERARGRCAAGSEIDNTLAYLAQFHMHRAACVCLDLPAELTTLYPEDVPDDRRLWTMFNNALKETGLKVPDVVEKKDPCWYVPFPDPEDTPDDRHPRIDFNDVVVGADLNGLRKSTMQRNPIYIQLNVL